jgi:hypothetical protein
VNHGKTLVQTFQAFAIKGGEGQTHGATNQGNGMVGGLMDTIKEPGSIHFGQCGPELLQ